MQSGMQKNVLWGTDKFLVPGGESKPWFLRCPDSSLASVMTALP